MSLTRSLIPQASLDSRSTASQIKFATSTGASAAAGIAAINSLGNLSGFAGPFAMGYLKDLTGNFTVGLLLLAGCAVIGAAVVISLRINAKREQSAGEVALAH
jgi:MFS transporter, ACS family, tartrate transporter